MVLKRLGSSVAIAVALLVSQAPTASAQGAPAKVDLVAAKKHYGEGEKLFKAGDFAGAEVEFKAADGIKSAPQTERYIGLCEDGAGHFTVAAEWFDRFLAHVPEKMASQGDEIRKRLAEIKAMPGKVHVESTPAGATVFVDDKVQAQPTPADLDVAPGPHTLKLTAPGRLPTTKPLDVTFASKQAVTATLEAEPPPPPPPVAVAPPPAPAPPPPPPPAPRSLLPAFVTGGLAIAAAGVGTVFGILTLSDKSDFDKNPTTTTADNGETHSLICDMSFGVALTFGVTSAVLFLTKDEPPVPAASADHPRTTASAPHKSRVTVTPTPIVSAHTGGAGVLVQF